MTRTRTINGFLAVSIIGAFLLGDATASEKRTVHPLSQGGDTRQLSTEVARLQEQMLMMQQQLAAVTQSTQDLSTTLREADEEKPKETLASLAEKVQALTVRVETLDRNTIPGLQRGMAKNGQAITALEQRVRRLE